MPGGFGDDGTFMEQERLHNSRADTPGEHEAVYYDRVRSEGYSEDYRGAEAGPSGHRRDSDDDYSRADDEDSLFDGEERESIYDEMMEDFDEHPAPRHAGEMHSHHEFPATPAGASESKTVLQSRGYISFGTRGPKYAVCSQVSTFWLTFGRRSDVEDLDLSSSIPLQNASAGAPRGNFSYVPFSCF